jgi:hypothetical protein
MFPYCDSLKYTRRSREGKTHANIDHVLIDRRRHSSILDVRSFRGADCYTDCYLVVAKVNGEAGKQTMKKMDMGRFDLKKLRKVKEQ